LEEIVIYSEEFNQSIKELVEILYLKNILDLELIVSFMQIKFMIL